MKYFHGQFSFSFEAWPQETTIKFVFSTVHRQLLCAQGDTGEMFITIGPDHFPEIEAHLLSMDLDSQNFTQSDHLPEWAVSQFINIEILSNREIVTLPLNVIEDDVEMQLASPEHQEPAFRPEVVEGLIKYITSITNGELPTIPLRALNSDVQKRLSDQQHYALYRAETLKAMIQIIKKLVMAPAIHAATKKSQ